jgi:hypothetical protein
MSWFLGRRRTGPLEARGVAEAIDGLVDPDPQVRVASVRRCGAARMEPAILLLRERLIDPERSVRGAAAAALGRIGGGRSSDALLRALRTHRLAPGRIVRELARAAPDFYLEAALEQPENRQVRAALALATGLRGPSATGTGALTAMLEGAEAERAAACHALGTLKHAPAVPLLVDSLLDESPCVRQAAGRALIRLGAPEPVREALGDVFHRRPPAPRRGLLARLRAVFQPNTSRRSKP